MSTGRLRGNALATLRQAVGAALPVQVTWAVLSAIWNFAGAWLIAHGERAPGPTATVGGGVVLLALAVAFVVALTRWPLVYLLLTIVAGLLGLYAVVGAFTQDPALWPSEVLRYAGVVLNGVGFAAAIAATVAWFRWKVTGDRPPLVRPR